MAADAALVPCPYFRKEGRGGDQEGDGAVTRGIQSRP